MRISVLFALVGVLLATTATSAEPLDVRASAPACDLASEVASRVSELGETGQSTWIIDPIADPNYWAWVDGEVVHISPVVSCNAIRDVVTHEWMHLLQGRAFPKRGAAAYESHEQFELVADCGSKLLGSHYTPYEAKVHPCGADEYDSAIWLIEKAGKSETAEAHSP